MNRWIFVIQLISFSVVAPISVWAKEDPLDEFTMKSLKDSVFIVETDEESGLESLDRISGKIDLGFSAPEQSFKSQDHYKPGPLGRQASLYSDD